ncbi:MAG TPA: ribosome small subunit-dependent GTPase A [Spirochaetota bacterium]|jgi:ribosome biogenesis GTPase|nr:ribosome small subunit-dependent GTPase A [Spirochaetota bacterium]HQA52686.1 ribosome small subunit-dependent GTPase A [Spirochaetota bacterium]
MKIESLGWKAANDKDFEEFRRQGFIPARIIRETRHIYEADAGSGAVQAQVSGRFIFESESRADYPTIGDWVACRDGGGILIIEELLPRKSRFSRKEAGVLTEEQIIAANIDYLCIVCGLDGGRNFSLRGIERYLSMAREGGASPVIVLNKCDIAEDRAKAVSEARNIAGDAQVFAVSALTGEGVDELLNKFDPFSTIAFSGPSGVGKSALVNSLLGSGHMRTGTQREDDLRGRHTTTHKELVVLRNGVMLIDTPGLRELQLWGGQESLDTSFSEIAQAALNCRFSDCSHQGEPGCAVVKLVESGAMTEARYKNYLDMKSELAYLESRLSEKGHLDRKKKEKDLSRLVKLYARDHKK